MTSFLQLEKSNTGSINPNAAVIFDNILTQSDDLYYDDTTGVITFGNAGTYTIHWFVAHQTGLSKNGSNFTLMTGAGVTIGSSNHYKVAPTSGFAIIHIEEAEETIKLINISEERTTLSDVTDVKAGLIIHSEGDQRPKLSGIHVQLREPEILEANDPVHFNTILNQTADRQIRYNSESFEFTVEKRGMYLVTWEVPVDGTDVEGFVSFSLFVDNIKRSQAFIPVPIGMISGSSLLSLEAGSVVTLVNTTGDKVSVNEHANMVIVEISDFQPLAD